MFRTFQTGIAVLLLAGSVGAKVAVAEEPIVVSQAEAREHLVKRVEPVYEPMASKSQIQGLVVIKVRIGKDGSVAETRVLTGHPLLTGLAEQAVKQWKYRPFTSNGDPAEALTTAEVPFWSPGFGGRDKQEQEINAGYFENEEECRDLFAMHQYQRAEGACRAAVNLVEKFPGDQVRRRCNAYETLGFTLLELQKSPEATDYFRREVALAEKALRGDDGYLALAYRALGAGLYATQDLKGAREYYQRSIQKLEHARRHARPDDLRPSFAQAEKKILQEYVKLLHESGDEAAAEAAKKQARSIE